ncbi:MAG TPA: response regulator transcription factor [Blastocatellia bacterium]|nr:response regulator transcription factor [Blastocatellia bacterium]
MISSGPPPIRVLLVEDHLLVRAGLRLLLESDPELVVVGEAGNRTEALAALAAEPDVILLDLDLGGESGLDFMPELMSRINGSRILVLTGMTDHEMHYRAVKLGAMGLVAKMEMAEVLIKAVKKVHEGEVWLNRTTVARMLSEMAQAGRPSEPDPDEMRIASLTEREREIIALVGEGCKNKQIAERLFISEPTVRHYLTSIFSKLNVTDRLGLIIYAYQFGLATLPAARSGKKPEPK